MSQDKIHPNWYFTIGKKTKMGTIQLTGRNLSIFNGRKIELIIEFGDIQQISKEVTKNDPVLKIIDSKGQEFLFKPLLVGEGDPEPLIDQLLAAIDGARNGAR